MLTLYRIIIVEDEDIIRKGIIETIQANKKNFQVFDAINGIEALEKIQSNQIDAMLLDIRMPKMDGLELLKLIREKQINIKTIILSGYDQFEYAQTALSYDVIDYILKPIKPKDVLQVIQKIEDELNRVKKQNEELQLLKKHYFQNKNQLKEKFFNDIINKRIMGNADFTNREKMLEVKLAGPRYQVIIFEINKFNLFLSEEKKQLIYYSIYKYFEKIIAKNNDLELFQINSNQFIIVININEDPYPTRKTINNFITALEKEYFIEVAAGVGNICDCWLKIRESYFEAAYAIRYCLLSNKEKTMEIKEIEGNKNCFDTYIDMDDFALLIKLGRIEQIREELNRVFNSFDLMPETYMDIERLNLFCIKTIIYALSSLKELYIDIKDIGINELDLLLELYNFKSIDEIKAFILRVIETIVTYINVNCSKRKKTTIEKVKNLINQNYNKDISIKTVANMLNLTPNYLGYLIKSELNMSFNDYLNKIKIKKAKELLKAGNLMVYEVAEKVGFSDSKYFSLVFKKNAGISPNEYK